VERVAFSCESLKVTTRLMHVVAWLLARRSILAGQPVDAAPLSGAAKTDAATVASLPKDARAIILASADLYERVERLARRMAQDEEVLKASSPAHMLRQRIERAF
jgi:regulator of CtrA degradation